MQPVKSVHHIGIAVRSIDAHRLFYQRTLGAVFEDEQDLPEMGVRVAFFRIGDVRLELVEPTDPNGRLQSFLDRRGEGLHHVAFLVEDLEARIAELKASGLQMVDDVPRQGAHRMRVAFVHPKSSGGVLTELCEPPADSPHP